MLESIKEELKKLKTDPLILIIGLIFPIAINLIVGWELSKGVMNHIPMAVVCYDHSELSRQVINYFDQNDSFDLKYYADSQQELEHLFNTSKIKAAMVIPKSFAADVAGLKSPSILMLYDGSHMSMTSIAKAKASEILMTIRTGAAIKQLEGRLNMSEEQAYNTAMPISFETRMLYNPAKNFNYFMLPGYGTIICQTGIGLTAVLAVTFLQNEERKRSILSYTAGKITFYGLLGSLAFITNLLAQIYLFKIPFRGSLMMAALLSVLLAFAVSALTIAVSAWIKNRTVAIVVIGLLLIPNSIMAGYTWPIMSMHFFYQKTAYIIPYYHYGENIRNLFLKGTIKHASADISFLVIFTLIMLGISILGIVTWQTISTEEAD